MIARIRAKVRQVHVSRWAFEVHRGIGPRSSVDFARRGVDALDARLEAQKENVESIRLKARRIR